jgi:hypothetical protein
MLQKLEKMLALVIHFLVLYFSKVFHRRKRKKVHDLRWESGQKETSRRSCPLSKWRQQCSLCEAIRRMPWLRPPGQELTSSALERTQATPDMAQIIVEHLMGDEAPDFVKGDTVETILGRVADVPFKPDQRVPADRTTAHEHNNREHEWRGHGARMPQKGGRGAVQCTMSRYFSRTVGAGGVCIVIVLKPQRYMAHCECQLNMLNSGPH